MDGILSQDEFVSLLQGLSAEIERGASMEGTLRYEWGEPGKYRVHAVLRTGNDFGQGGVVLVGKPWEDSEAEPCDAVLFHGPGHQSKTPCEETGPHEIHRCIYGEWRQEARWRTGEYTGQCRAQGIELNPESYPESMGMTGFFDEPPTLAEDR